MTTKPKKYSKDKQILKKHVAAIHIGAKLSLLQRKLVNALLYNAYDQLLTAKEHQISASLLCEMIGFDSHNSAYLKGALKGLMETVVEFDVLEDDGETSWEVNQTGFTGDHKAWKISHDQRKFRKPLFDRSSGARSALGT